MGFEIATNPPLATSQPPGLLLTYTSPNVDSWQEETLLLPSMGEFGFTRRMVHTILMRAINRPTSIQVFNNQNIGTYLFLTRDGQQKSSIISTRLFWVGVPGGGDDEELPMALWHNPFPFPVRGGDGMTINTPGDADATPIQDFELYIELGPELPAPRPG